MGPKSAGYGFLHDTLSAVGAKLEDELEDEPGPRPPAPGPRPPAPGAR